jgi:hypothetical protein
MVIKIRLAISCQVAKQLLCFVTMLFVSFNSFSQEVLLPSHTNDSAYNGGTVVLKGYNGADGPYIFKDTLFRVTRSSQFLKEINFSKDSLLVEVDNEDKDAFHVALKTAYNDPKSIYVASDHMMVIADIEGKYNAFASFLYSNKIIDKDHNWIFNDGKLVLVGDFVDRGINVAPVLWLIYKLEQQAELCGGKVHFILGNHEILNFQGKHRYNQLKYIKIAQQISGLSNKEDAVKYMYSNASELGKWLATKNVIEKIGDYIFVHAGLSPEILDYKLSFDAINNKARSQYHKIEASKTTKPENTETVDFIFGSKGPLWYRGLVVEHYKYPLINEEDLDKVLNYYSAKKIVIGHTVVNTISTSYQGKVIRVDVLHGNDKFSGRTKGLLIENGIEYIVNDLGEKALL